jgi:hypothetical protein
MRCNHTTTAQSQQQIRITKPACNALHNTRVWTATHRHQHRVIFAGEARFGPIVHALSRHIVFVIAHKHAHFAVDARRQRTACNTDKEIDGGEMSNPSNSK